MSTVEGEDECVLELQSFCRGGCAGVARLNQVAQSVYQHFGVYSTERQLRMAFRAGLSVEAQEGKVIRFVVPAEGPGLADDAPLGPWLTSNHPGKRPKTDPGPAHDTPLRPGF